MSKVLLREYYALCEGGVCQDLLTEAEKRDIKENNAMYLTGLMQQCDVQNGNGRVYPQDVVGISSRGLGSVKEEGGETIVEDDFQLICFDFVSEPSTPNAYMNLQEGKNYQEPNIFTKADRINRALNNILRDK